MYNTPRAATIIAKTDGILWSVDRTTFQHIVLRQAFLKRQLYENWLSSVPLLASLSAYERANLADALGSHTYEDGASIIQEGEPGEEMYFIEDGCVEISAKNCKGEEVVLKQLHKNDYFGELALILHVPRIASARAVGRTKLAGQEIIMYPGHLPSKSESHQHGFISHRQTPPILNSSQQPSRNPAVLSPPISTANHFIFCRHEIFLSNSLIGCVIGKGGSRINEIREMSQATITISRHDENRIIRRIVIVGEQTSVERAVVLIRESIDLYKHMLGMNSQYPVNQSPPHTNNDRANVFDRTLNPGYYGVGIRCDQHRSDSVQSNNELNQVETSLQNVREYSTNPWNTQVRDSEILRGSRTASVVRTSQVDTPSSSSPPSDLSRPMTHFYLMCGDNRTLQEIVNLLQMFRINA
uniref:Cyclic nucleotide-binding domain-containing protein n=1 Tax=Trichobilharzia regenti TaxID=157069 RepID=A0AA85JP44_TRIRE|nr:unnamed protein product [Trichobilharzia regenti]